MTDRGARVRLRRRSLLGWVSATLPVTLVSCNDEPVTRSSTPPAPIDHQELLTKYFGEPGLRDAETIGNHHVQFQRWDAGQAFDETAQTRALIDDSHDIDAALTALDQRVIDDFSELQLVDVAGWTLSRTEVDLCVMVWLG